MKRSGQGSNRPGKRRTVSSRTMRRYYPEFGGRQLFRNIFRKGYSFPKIHNFKRTCSIRAIAPDGVAAQNFFGYNFALSDLPTSADFTNLYDQYKFNGIKVKFYLTQDTSNSAAGTGKYPYMGVVVDYDTSTTPGSADELRQYSNLKTHNFSENNREFTMYFKPKVLMEIYRTAISTASAPCSPPWLSTVNSDVQHFGIRGYVGNHQDSDYIITVETTYYFQCKNPR